MIKLNDNSLFIGQIKQVLKSFNLPQCRAIDKNRFDSTHPFPYIDSKHYIINSNINVYKDGVLKHIQNYNFNDKVVNLTSNLTMSNIIYDSTTHKYLGKYLRFLKDYSKLDLMSMYNCFSGEEYKYNTNIDLQTRNYRVIDIKDSTYVVYAIPIRFFENYTIAVNSDFPFEVFCALTKNGNLIKINTINQNLIDSTYRKIRHCNFVDTYLYEGVNYENIMSKGIEEVKALLIEEEDLRLFIKIPKTIKSSIVVLEGDFTKCSKFDIIDGSHTLIGGLTGVKVEEREKSYIQWNGDFDYKSKLQLLDFYNVQGNALIADRLVEYLTGNSITNISEGYDILKMQKDLYDNYYLDVIPSGIWDWEKDKNEKDRNVDRESIYKVVSESNINSKKFDVISYVDRDVESLINLVDKEIE